MPSRRIPKISRSKAKEMNQICFYVNGKKHLVADNDCFLMMSDYLRRLAALTGTKVVCAEGDCGACSILVAWPARWESQKKNSKGKFHSRSAFRLVNSCILPVHQVHGASVVSVEGLQDERDCLSEVQDQLVKQNASQCGFCTPGFAMALSHLALQSDKRDAQDVKNYCTGNLCRCTGYESIVKAGMALSKQAMSDFENRYLGPSIQQDLKKVSGLALRIQHASKFYFQPSKIQQIAGELKIQTKKSDSTSGIRFLGSGTDLGVLHNKEKIDLDSVISLSGIPQLFQISNLKKATVVGAKVDLETLRKSVKITHGEFSKFLNLFASPPIRNVATLAGNIANASPIGDTAPYLLVMNATLKIETAKAPFSKWVELNSFYKNYKVTALKPGEWISQIKIPNPAQSQFTRLYKISQRRDLDISSVSAAITVDRNKNKLSNFRIALGGVAAFPLRLTELEKFFAEEGISNDTLKTALKRIPEWIKPLSDHRAGKEYRLLMVAQFLNRFLREAFSTELSSKRAE